MTSVLRGQGTTITLNTSALVSGPIEISGVVDVDIVNSIPLTISGGINVENFNISGLTVVTNPYVYLSGDSNTVNILNPVELSGTSSVSISGVPTVTISGVVQTNISSTPITISGPISLDPANLGAFGRQRTAQPFTLFDMNSILGRDPIRMVEDISGSATIAGHSNSYVLMTVPATNGDRAIYQSREYIPYQPGKSRLAYMTGVLIGDSNASNAVSRIGSFDGENGHFFMFSNGNQYITERSFGTDCNIIRSNWFDPMDGTGPSGCNVDFTKGNIFMLDQEWLGVGQVRMGLVIAGSFYYTQYWTHAGANASNQPYSKMAKLPIRYELQSLGDSNTMRSICASVQSEGGFLPFGRTFDQQSSNAYTLSTSNRWQPVISLRLRPASNGYPYNRVTAKLKDIDIFSTDNQDYGAWAVLHNPTFGVESTSFSNFDTARDSAVQVRQHVATETITDEGYRVDSGFWTSRVNLRFSSTVEDIVRAMPLAADVSGDSDVITLAMRVLVGNEASIQTNMKWLEII